jgi:hypothetical protein
LSNSKITKRILGAGAAVALSAGIGLATAAPAQADVWDRVAECESSGNWGINTGNGYYGGLQFSQQTWEGYGGSGNPANASKAEQIRVAKKVLQGQGPGAWPVCSVEAGLTQANGGAASGSSDSGSSNSQNNYSSNDQGSDNGNSEDYQPRHSSGDYSSESEYQQPKRSYEGSGEYVTIQSGDTLAEIAAEHDVEGGWEALWSINSDSISNPDVIMAGAKIEL